MENIREDGSAFLVKTAELRGLNENFAIRVENVSFACSC
jgi:hypothetical protein